MKWTLEKFRSSQNLAPFILPVNCFKKRETPTKSGRRCRERTQKKILSEKKSHNVHAVVTKRSFKFKCSRDKIRTFLSIVYIQISLESKPSFFLAPAPLKYILLEIWSTLIFVLLKWEDKEVTKENAVKPNMQFTHGVSYPFS